jgi:hypothetical protein
LVCGGSVKLEVKLKFKNLMNYQENAAVNFNNGFFFLKRGRASISKGRRSE